MPRRPRAHQHEHSAARGRGGRAHPIIFDFEGGWGKPKSEDLDAIQKALELAGVEFIERGVKLRKGAGE